MTKNERAQLAQLSLQAFGNKNKYRKFLEKGEPVRETAKTANGQTVPVTRYCIRTVDEVKALMLDKIEEKLKETQKTKEVTNEEAPINPAPATNV